MIDLSAARRAMVDCQVRPSDVTRYALIEAMLWAPREQFVPRSKREIAYAETDIEVADGRFLLAPRTLAKMIEAADVGPTDLVLDLAPATGYSTAVLSRVAEAVVAVEPDEALVKQASAALDALEVDNAAITAGDPTAGDAVHGPFDVIFVNGAVQQLPEALFQQMKPGSRLVAIVEEGGTGKCLRYTRAGDGVSKRYMFDAQAPSLDEFRSDTGFTF